MTWEKFTFYNYKPVGILYVDSSIFRLNIQLLGQKKNKVSCGEKKCTENIHLQASEWQNRKYPNSNWIKA